jgi:hypothetical protein
MDYLYFWNNLNDKVIQLSLDCPFWYFLSTGSKLDLQLVFQKATGKACERGTRNAIFRSMTVFNKYLFCQFIIRKKELLSLSEDLGPPLAFSGISITPSFQSSVLCFLCLFVFVLCLVYNIAIMSGLSICYA